MGQTRRRNKRNVSSFQDPFWSLVETAQRLQAPGGCPWDRSQTVDSLLPHLIEETWEVFEAVRSRHYEDLQEELGDVLYTVLFLTLIAQRRRWCDLSTLLNKTHEKMIRRHPHVFGAQRASTAHEAYRHWQASKQSEGRSRHSPSHTFQQLLIEWWEWLRRHPETVLTSFSPDGNPSLPLRHARRPSVRRKPVREKRR